jgi:uncharacterized protein
MIQAQIFIDKDDLYQNRKLHEFVMEFLLSKKVSGATAFEGLSGFGSNLQLQRPDRLFSFDEPPMLITFIDEEEKAKSVLKELRELFKGGLIITTHVEKW